MRRGRAVPHLWARITTFGLVLVCATTAGCGVFGPSASAPTDGPNTKLGKSCAKLIGKATKAAAALRSYHFTAQETERQDKTGGGAPDKQTMKVYGDVSRGSQLRYKMNMQIGSSHAGSFAATIVVIGSDHYMKPNAAWGALLKLAYAKESKNWKPWLLSQHGPVTDKAYLQALDPAKLLKMLVKSGVDATYDGREKVGGVSTTHCSGRSPSQGSKRGEVWIDGSDRLVKWRVDADDGPATLIYSAFNKPVTITRPPAGQVHKVK